MIPVFTWIYNLFIHFYRGAKIEATLTFQNRGRRQMREYPVTEATEVHNGVRVWDGRGRDLMRDWEVITNFKLTLSNNSTKNAYEVTLTNVRDCFDSTTHIQNPLIIKAGEQYELVVTINQIISVRTGQETEAYPAIPVERENKILIVEYKNEAGVFLNTKFWVSTKQPPTNIFSYRQKPQP